jgi:hypothetical protein
MKQHAITYVLINTLHYLLICLPLVDRLIAFRMIASLAATVVSAFVCYLPARRDRLSAFRKIAS